MLKGSTFIPAFLVCLAAGPAIAETDAKADALLAAAKQAMGGAALDKVTSWHEHGAIHAGGVDGTYEAWTDLPKLENTDSYMLGPASGSEGWDGAQYWSTDSSKAVRVEKSGEAVAQAIQSAYSGGLAFFYPARHAAKIAYDGAKTEGATAYETITVTPEGAEPFEVWFDPVTHLIAREVQLTGGQPRATIFEDWRKVAGVEVPFKTTQRTANNPKYDQVATAAAIELSVPEPAGLFAPPPPPKDDTMWPAGQASVTVPFELFNNHIYLDVAINGAAPKPFMFDTGAINVLYQDQLAGYGMKAEGALPGGGFGDAVSAFGFAKAKSVAVGGLALPDQVFITMAGDTFNKVEGAPSAGLIGYEFGHRTAMTIDYAKRTFTFTKFASFQPPVGAAAIPITFDAHVPMVEASIDGIKGEFEVDTGARSALTLMHPFAVANKLVEKYHAVHVATTGYGAGGPSKALLARAGVLTIGSIELKAPVVDLVMDEHGAAAAARTAGNIGGDLLKRFTVTFDYEHSLMWLQPNELASQPDVFDRAGLWVQEGKDGAIEIADVSKHGPGAAAGLAVGDEITQVDGKPAAQMRVYDLREKFKSAPGTKVALTVKGKSGERKLDLTLADQI